MNVRNWLSSFFEIHRRDVRGGLILILATLIALIWANSPWSNLYFALWHTELSVSLGQFAITKSIAHWISEGLMAIFFFVVGLEIKREWLIGALSTTGKARLPVIAALGGMALPALIYMLFNMGGPGDHGWGIPMATDIAFAIGILALFGRKIPDTLKIFLLAIAIVDDIGAVLIIALVYSTEIAWTNLAICALILALLIIYNRSGINSIYPYIISGIVMWYFFLESGIHATVVGVLVAFIIPARRPISDDKFIETGRSLLDDFEAESKRDRGRLTSPGQQEAIDTLETLASVAETPMKRLERLLRPWVLYFVMPLFALANAGIALNETSLSQLSDPIVYGIILGLVIGKPLGIFSFSWLAVRLGIADAIQDVGLRQMLGVGFIAGVGFTMSLFISTLAFGDGLSNTIAKTGILVGSFLSALFGLILLRMSFSGSERANEN